MKTYLQTGAEICGQYRYRLWREWSWPLISNGDGAPPMPRTVLWVMLNPSTADADADDATIRRCVGFSKCWGFDGLMVVNLFAYRATDPADLPKGDTAIGPGNDATIRAEAAKAALIVVAWGGNKAADRRGPCVADILQPYEVKCLGETLKGHPVHPLRLPASRPLKDWLF